MNPTAAKFTPDGIPVDAPAQPEPMWRPNLTESQRRLFDEPVERHRLGGFVRFAPTEEQPFRFITDPKQYWMVHSPRRGPTAFRHPDEASAQTEAQRLARENPGVEFFVLEAKEVFCSPIRRTGFRADAIIFDEISPL